LVIPNKINKVKEKSRIDEIKIYPNPTSERIHISAPDINNILVTDILGQIVLKDTTTKEIDLSSYPKGVYFVQITDNHNVKYIFKVFKSQ
jgi:hypothetical protein